jgi:hypothetical protein
MQPPEVIPLSAGENPPAGELLGLPAPGDARQADGLEGSGPPSGPSGLGAGEPYAAEGSLPLLPAPAGQQTGEPEQAILAAEQLEWEKKPTGGLARLVTGALLAGRAATERFLGKPEQPAPEPLSEDEIERRLGLRETPAIELPAPEESALQYESADEGELDLRSATLEGLETTTQSEAPPEAFEGLEEDLGERVAAFGEQVDQEEYHAEDSLPAQEGKRTAVPSNVPAFEDFDLGDETLVSTGQVGAGDQNLAQVSQAEGLAPTVRVEALDTAPEALEEGGSPSGSAEPAVAPAPVLGYDEIRPVALEDYQPPEPDRTPAQIARQRMIQVGIVAAMLAVATLAVCCLGIYAFQAPLRAMFFRPVAALPPTPTRSPVPVPMRLTMPGGWSIDLNQGGLKDGQWIPESPEWLGGSEINRWVAIPWGKEIEAVFRTMQPGDTLTLEMDNLDKLEYQVSFVKEVPRGMVGPLWTNEPSLTIVLSRSSPVRPISDPLPETRWMLVAYPK